jgi:hypothetical protein
MDRNHMNEISCYYRNDNGEGLLLSIYVNGKFVVDMDVHGALSFRDCYENESYMKSLKHFTNFKTEF